MYERSTASSMPNCAEALRPPTSLFGGCLPCPRAPKNSSTLAVTAADSSCLRCLLESGQPFLIGRPGMGAPEEVSCQIATGTVYHASFKGHSENATAIASAFFASERATLKTLNGVLTASEEDARMYARCYWAAVNASDLIVRIGGGIDMPLRKPLDVCSRSGAKHFHKTDVLLARSGHFPSRVFQGYFALNPWMLVADRLVSHQAPGADSESHTHLLSAAFAWVHALRGKTVAIVHPFHTSIPSQLAKGGAALWGPYARYVMPHGIRFKVVAAPQNLAKSRESANWHAAFDTLVARTDAAMPFDLAVIACGGLGMPLGAHLRATNRSAMYNGGDLQMWFGVYGRRWDRDVGRLNVSFAHNWVRPLANETPLGAGAVEGGTYW
jgi:hypothetical protein